MAISNMCNYIPVEVSRGMATKLRLVLGATRTIWLHWSINTSMRARVSRTQFQSYHFHRNDHHRMGFSVRQIKAGSNFVNNLYARCYHWSIAVRHDFRQVRHLLKYQLVVSALIFIPHRYGRKWALVGAIVMQLASGISAASVPSLWLFNVMRFCLGASVAGATTTRLVASSRGD